jgi:hypothetical protein
MRYLAFCLISFFTTIGISQISNWDYYEFSKGVKVRLPVEPIKRVVRDLNVFQIEGGNYDWKIISMPLGSFTKDDSKLNFLGQVMNLNNKINEDPYLTVIEDSVLSIKGHPLFYSYTHHLNILDTSQNFHSIQFYLRIEKKVYISNLKFYKESKVKWKEFAELLNTIKLPKCEEVDSLVIKGEEEYFVNFDNEKFLKMVYCDLPSIEKTKSYHKLLSIHVDFYLTETGRVSAVSLESDKMILITRETEAKLKEYFSSFNFLRIPKETESSNRKFEFVLFLTDFAKKYYCK